MSDVVKSIFEELEARFGALSGFTVYNGRVIDPSNGDKVPSIGYFFNDGDLGEADLTLVKEADSNQRRSSADQRLLHLAVEAVDKLTDPKSPMVELEDLHQQIIDVLIKPGARFGGKAIAEPLIRKRRAYVIDPVADIGKVELQVEIPYTQRY
ncbi:MAG TPA: hypothetical protein VKA19_02260 [Alphaproteobacteria bacterium]|nr:hypothetical protein [Alphaproteobacteria bacterium]